MLDQTIDIIENLIEIIEKDFTPKQKFKGLLCLSEYDLWDPKWSAEEAVIIHKILQLLNGKLSIFEIAEKIDVSFDFVADFVSKLKDKNLVDEC